MKTTRRQYPVIVWKENDLYVASVFGLELASQGKTEREALQNLQEALDLFLEEDKKLEIPMVYDEVKLSSVYA